METSMNDVVQGRLDHRLPSLCDDCLTGQAKVIADRLGRLLATKLGAALEREFHWHFALDEVGLDPEDRYAWGFLVICDGNATWALFLSHSGDGLLSFCGQVVNEEGVDLINNRNVIGNLVRDAMGAFRNAGGRY
jgi:hypothetical protein